jgi:hypothetical protein
MDVVGDAINWSEVARPALIAAVAAHEHSRSQTMDSAIERLRASKQEADQEDELEGRQDGRDWAKNYAEYRELQRLMRLVDRDDLEPFDKLWSAVGETMNQTEVREYCFDSAEAEMSDEYVEAFIRGALDFFCEVSGKL